MQVNRRLIKFIDYIQTNNDLTIKDAATSLKCNERSIRYNIELLNNMFHSYDLPTISLSKGKIIFDSHNYQEASLLSLVQSNRYDKSERTSYIMYQLLFNNKLNLALLSRDLHVSRTSIKKDVHDVYQSLSSYNLHIEKHHLYCEELMLRHLIAQQFSTQLINFTPTSDTHQEYQLIYHLIDNQISLELKYKLKQWTFNLLATLDNQNHFEAIFAYLMIALMRIKQYHRVKQVNRAKYLMTTHEYRILNQHLPALEAIIGFSFDKHEVLAFSDKLQGYLSYHGNTEVLDNWAGIVMVVKTVIQEISAALMVNLVDDTVLLENILNHLKPALYRMKHTGLGDHEIYMGVIEPYQHIFNIIKEKLIYLETFVGLSFPDNEVALLTIHFLAAINQVNPIAIRPTNVLLICSGGYGTTTLITKQISDLYNVKITKILPYNDFSETVIQDIDLIITTLKIDHKLKINLSIPLIQISPFLLEADRKILREHLKENGYNQDKVNYVLNIIKANPLIKDEPYLISKLEEAFSIKQSLTPIRMNRLLDFVNQNRIHYLQHVDNWEEAIKKACAPLLNNQEIKASYVQEIITITKMYDAHFVLGNRVALLHGEVAVNIKKSAINILFVKDDIIFPANKHANLLIVIAAKNTKDHIKSIEEIINFIDSYEFKKGIKTVTNSEEIYQLIIHYFEKRGI